MIGIIFNPTARGNKAARFRKVLESLASDIRVAPTRAAGDARQLAAGFVESGVDLIVAAGGDGTVNEVLNGICDTPKGLQRTRLGVIPLGTINVFAKETGIPENIAGALEVLRSGCERRIDLPLAEFSGPDGHPVRQHFILMAGAGLNSQAIGLVNWELKKKVGQLAYVWAGLQALSRPHPVVTVTMDGHRESGELAEVGNGRFYGGRYPVFPEARLDDGRLDVTLFPRVDWGIALRVYLRLLLDRIATSPDARLRQGHTLHLGSTEPMALHLDGDVVGQLPVTITVQHRALRVVVPATVANRTGRSLRRSI